jgi:hypothetical protein
LGGAVVAIIIVTVFIHAGGAVTIHAGGAFTLAGRAILLIVVVIFFVVRVVVQEVIVILILELGTNIGRCASD